MAEAHAQRQREVQLEHLLLAIVRTGGTGAELLAERGLTATRLASSNASSSPAAHGIQIEDSSDKSIYEQIVEQVTEAIATGRFRPNERLPTVRRLADELDVAPGTVGRAYGELERQGLIITEGARGSRVARRDHRTEGVDRSDTLAGLLRPVAVAAFHLGATAAEVRAALEEALRGIFDRHD